MTTASGYLLAKMDMFPLAAARGAGQVILVRKVRKDPNARTLTPGGLEHLTPCIAVLQDYLELHGG